MSETTIREDLAKLMDEIQPMVDDDCMSGATGQLIGAALKKIHSKTADDQWTLMAAALGKIAEELKWLRLTAFAANRSTIMRERDNSMIAHKVYERVEQDTRDL